MLLPACCVVEDGGGGGLIADWAVLDGGGPIPLVPGVIPAGFLLAEPPGPTAGAKRGPLSIRCDIVRAVCVLERKEGLSGLQQTQNAGAAAAVKNSSTRRRVGGRQAGTEGTVTQLGCEINGWYYNIA